MRKALFFLFLVLGIPLARNCLAQTAQEGARPANPAVSGRWSINADLFGASIDFSLKLDQVGDKLTGNFQGIPLEGTLQGNAIHFVTKHDQGS